MYSFGGISSLNLGPISVGGIPGGFSIGGVSGSDITSLIQSGTSLYNSLTGSDKPSAGGDGYPNGTALNYKGDYNTKHAPGQPSDNEIVTLLSVMSAADVSTLRAAYLRARPKASWADVISMPYMIGIAAMGGDDFKRNSDEEYLYGILSGLLTKYNISASTATSGPATPQGTPSNSVAPAPAQTASTSTGANPDTPWYQDLLHGIENIGSNIVHTVQNVVTSGASAAVQAGTASSAAANNASAATGGFLQPTTMIFLVALVGAFLLLRKH